MDPPEYKQFKPFIQMAQELQQINPMFAYYIKTYAVQKAHAIYKQMPPDNPNKNV